MKKNLKIMLITLITICMLFVITGCGKKEETINTEDNEGALLQETSNNDKENSEEEKAEKELEFSMGEWKDDVYTNDFLGLKFELPEGWSYSSKDEIASMMNVGVELLNDDQKQLAEVANLNSVYYLVATDSNTGSNLSVMSEKTLVNLTTDYYINALKTQLSALESINYTVTGTSKETVGGREYDVLSLNAEVNGVTLLQKYYVYKMDKYFVVLIATSTNGDSGFKTMTEAFK